MTSLRLVEVLREQGKPAMTDLLIEWIRKGSWVDILVGAALSIPISVLGGIYAGLVVGRLARFEALRTELKRFILAIDYMQDGPRTRYKMHRGYEETLSIWSEFAHLGHRRAADTVNEIMAEIRDATGPSQGVEQTPDEANKRYLAWQRRCREMDPNWRVILTLKPKV